MINSLIRFCLENKLVVSLLTAGLIFWGLAVAPFDWKLDFLPRSPVPVDAIPDIGENQQIVFTEWSGRSPQDIEDQITYPLTTALLGLPEVKTVRSFSLFGFSSIYVIFKEDADFYWTRSRILEKLNSLPTGTLPPAVQPQLGPDATALGQVFWYTLEGYSQNQSDNTPSGGWDPQELRSIQDWYVRYALQGVDGVAEVSSIGGYVKEYQIDVDPDALRTFDITLPQVFSAVRGSNLDVGARTIEINSAEYVIRGLGFIKSLDDLRQTVITQRDNIPITLDQVAHIGFGPALRRGALDKAGAEAVGGVVVTRFGENPLEVIQRVKAKIAEISPGLPSKTLEDGRVSQVQIVPFYDRTQLIQETLGTLEEAVSLEILVTVIVVLILILRVRSALLISCVLPLAVLIAFIGMKLFGIDANIVALSGIAIAIGTVVDMGIVIVENIQRHLEKRRLESALPQKLSSKESLELIYQATTEVGGAVFTAVLTTVISFLPVFTMVAEEGRLFRPLAFTKTFALIGSIIVALAIIPPLAHMLLARWSPAETPFKKPRFTLGKLNSKALACIALALFASILLSRQWEPFGPANGLANLLFVIVSIGGLLLPMLAFIWFYPQILRLVLRMKALFCLCVVMIVAFGFTAWLGWQRTTSWMPQFAQDTALYQKVSKILPGFGDEFMPPLDEGSFLFMPTTMPHASIGEVMDVLRKQDMAINAIPEVESAVGKLGRAESPLDPAPISMIETIISYKSEYKTDEQGKVINFAYDKKKGAFERDEKGALMPDDSGRPFRQWRDHIHSPDDIWKEIISVSKIPGTTSAPKLQPIAARLVMLQSGVRAPMAFRVSGPDLQTIETVALELEQKLKHVPSINPETVFADRIVGKPYLEIDIDRSAIARYGISIAAVQEVIEVAIGGKPITMTVEGRERYPVRVRYQRELRDSIESIEQILVAAPDGTQIPLKELATIEYLRGPQVIKSENTFLVGYVIFDKQAGYSEVEVVEEANAFLRAELESGTWSLPAGVAFPKAIGNYENQVRAEKTLSVVLPIALLAIFLILYLQFRKTLITLLVFSGIAVAWSGGFILIWLYGQSWFLDVNVFGYSLRDIFQIETINLSVAVWVGFLALFGIATDDGVIMATYLEQRFREATPSSKAELHTLVVEAAQRRVRPAMMTIATTLLALLPVLTSSGRGSDVMAPMAIPTFGGMLLAIVTIFVVPALYCSLEEWKLAKRLRNAPADASTANDAAN